MKILHILRDPNNKYAIEAVTSHGIDTDTELILMHDAVYLKISCAGVKTFACKNDVDTRGIKSAWETIDYDDIIKKVFESDLVTCW
ncbi:MAG: hypothetical protein A2Z59_10260 [Nitrospinae bacterium RIFCSPLOWO2_02_39_17]|nr:MAG: hypothetical protein A2Z59_10260 [Nitrospinae bacterium RIFCSPLOWO2_02_39_17]